MLLKSLFDWAVGLLSVALTLTLVAAKGQAAEPPKPDQPVGATIEAISSSQVQADLDKFYSSNPAIVNYVVNDVGYSVATRNKVLSVCEHGGVSGDEAALQSSQVAACAPMIYFFYSYGQTHSSLGALALAEDIYDYAVIDVHGPFDTQTTLDSLLRGWGLPVTAGPVPPESTLADSLISSARTAIDHAAGVHISVTTRSARGPLFVAQSNSGQGSSTEQLKLGVATANLIVTPKAAYFNGNGRGLTKFFGMSPREVRRIGSSWVSAVASTSQYNSLGPPSLIESLAGTILPSTTAVSVTVVSVDGQRAYDLRWTDFDPSIGSNSSDTLLLSPLPGNLPITATTSADGRLERTKFSHWGEHVDPSTPLHPLSFADVATG